MNSDKVKKSKKKQVKTDDEPTQDNDKYTQNDNQKQDDKPTKDNEENNEEQSDKKKTMSKKTIIIICVIAAIVIGIVVGLIIFLKNRKLKNNNTCPSSCKICKSINIKQLEKKELYSEPIPLTDMKITYTQYTMKCTFLEKSPSIGIDDIVFYRNNKKMNSNTIIYLNVFDENGDSLVTYKNEQQLKNKEIVLDVTTYNSSLVGSDKTIKTKRTLYFTFILKSGTSDKGTYFANIMFNGNSVTCIGLTDHL